MEAIVYIFSRQMETIYIFFVQTGRSSARLQRGSSRVGFLPSQVKPPTDVPVDLTKESFDAVEDVQTFTLQASQLAVVIASYDKTIGRIRILVCTTVFVKPACMLYIL